MSVCGQKNVRRVVALLVGAAALGSIHAAQAADAAADEEGTLEEVVVTGVARPVNRLQSSVSTSALNVESIAEVAPRSVAEVFRSLPGIRAESSGGEGNANITIRGIPLATGGAKYLQLHEDGLPVCEYGDLNFANCDNFIRQDWSIARIESIRGGSASTFASNSPGGIINLISDTGEREGGAFGVTTGVDFDQQRADFEYGGAFSDTLRFHVGGFYRQGEGVRKTGFNGDRGGQVKINVTKEFDGGYLRLHVKQLNDRVTTYLPSPVRVKSNGSFGAVDGYDASSESLHSPYQTTISTFDAFGNRLNRDITDGIHAKVSSFGLEFNREFAGGWTLNDKFRTSKTTGSWISPFTDGVGTAGALADSLCAGSPNATLNGVSTAASGCTNTVVTLANGPGAGSVYNRSALAFNNLIFDTTFNDVGLDVNDLKLTKAFEGGAALTVGYYRSQQAVDIDWNSWQFYLQTVQGAGAQNLNVVSSTGQRIVNDGLYFPGLLSWAWDLDYTTSAPYANFSWQGERFNFDASVRRDNTQARGQASRICCGKGAFGSSPTSGILVDMDNDGNIGFWESRGVAVASTQAGREPVRYNANNTSFSLGGTWMLSGDSSVFARYSDGGRAIADRLLQIGGTLNANGSLTSTTDGYDNVSQLELGYKLKRGPYEVYLTAFDTTTEETNAEITSGLTFVREYRAQGLEVEGSWEAANGFRVSGNLTWTDAEINKDRNNAAIVGNKPRRQADLIYTITPAWRGDRFSVGATLQGSTDYYVGDVNQLKQNAYMLVHLFGSYRFSDALSMSLNVNNLTDKFVVTEVEEGTAAAGGIVRARPLSARSTALSLRYQF
ncbi:MAG: TonB-dependent receptor [Proteobacteria bacterium]|jgi:outer membrane receptor protein involved in Fe transport|nr:TonB-dependent receptor [Pseudomonadota bacterium]MBK7115528.1 TonB-dependent receptor [Pseudomonadota bacterium]MCC6630684.1 TonB-dependent receptor [Gammaproteobacteria bacterium]